MLRFCRKIAVGKVPEQTAARIMTIKKNIQKNSRKNISHRPVIMMPAALPVYFASLLLKLRFPEACSWKYPTIKPTEIHMISTLILIFQAV